MRRSLVVTTALGLSLALMAGTASLAQDATPVPAPAAIVSEVLGRTSPVEVADQELALGRVTIMPGATIPVHHHPGSQIGVVVQGTLTYSVFAGSVEWLHGSEPTGAATTIEPGDTVHVPAGDALLENPGAIHQGRNEGRVPVVIYLSTLFPAGAPTAVLDAATPTP